MAQPAMTTAFESSTYCGWTSPGMPRSLPPGLKIRVAGRRHNYSGRGRPPNVFAAKSSRIARQLLLHPQRFQTQAEVARQTQVGDGYVSKIVRRLEQEQYLDANDDGAVRPLHPNLLLDAWHAAYDFSHRRILKGHVPARSVDELLQRIFKSLSCEKLEYAATGSVRPGPRPTSRPFGW